tara:strand:+ start:153 stop:557 length:405 start_codon:yes stop_codon:yes gene_type:complete
MSSNSYLNKTDFFSGYDELNSIITNIFFNENSNNKPIYMDWADVQDDTVRKASNNKFNTKSQLLVSLGAVVKKTLYKRSNPTFKEHEIRVRFWQEEIKIKVAEIFGQNLRTKFIDMRQINIRPQDFIRELSKND